MRGVERDDVGAGTRRQAGDWLRKRLGAAGQRHPDRVRRLAEPRDLAAEPVAVRVKQAEQRPVDGVPGGEQVPVLLLVTVLTSDWT